jgi:predicted anti-sigma-YlaC factor YlaD
MDCRQIQSVLALAVGQDPCDPVDEQAVRAHLSDCPCCRRFRQELEASHAALLESRVHRGLWPQVAACLAEWECRPRFARFNVWVPSVAAVAASLLLISVAVLEVDHHTHQWLPSVVQDRSTPRNLFLTDPNFTASRGQMLSPDDVIRWRQMQHQQLQQAGMPLTPRPVPEW